MAVVHIPGLLLPLTGGAQDAEVTGSTVEELIEQLDVRYPGIKERLIEGGQLRAGLSVFVDGSIRREGLECEVSPQGDVHFIPAIAGGQ
jgi:molybdopterin converting factor small subunit